MSDPIRSPRPAPPAAVLRDPLPGARPVLLDGVLERQRFHPLLMAALVFVGGLLVYLVVGSVAMAAAAVVGAGGEASVEEILESMGESPVAVFGGNAVGQFLGFFLFVWMVARMHTAQVADFLRLRRGDGPQLALAAGGLLALLPFVSWLGALNAQMPLPEGLRAWEEQQAALLDQVLGGGMNVGLALLFAAVTPALCEEVMFRGYLQRQVERRLGAAWSIVLVGVFFGLFHLRLLQALPLAALGLYLGYVVWVSGSLWPGVLVHLLNNGLAVLVSDYARRSPGLGEGGLEAMEVPWYLAGAGLVLALGACEALRRRRAHLLLAAPSFPSDRLAR